MELGPIHIRASDEDGRRFPCACHTEPACIWLICFTRNDAGYYAIVPLRKLTPPYWHVFDDAFRLLEDMYEHPELYSDV